MKPVTQVPLSRKKVETILHDLEILVVLLNRLGSEFHDDLPQLAMETSKFLVEIRAVQKLARTRRCLSEAFDSHSNEKEISDLERSLENLSVWPHHKMNSRKRRDRAKLRGRIRRAIRGRYPLLPLQILHPQL